MNNHFSYGQPEMEQLIRQDPILGKIIAEVGFIERQVRPDPFTAIMRNLIGQQISNKAAATVFERFTQLLGAISPEQVLAIPAEDLRGCGISLKKIANMKEISRQMVSGELNLSQIPEMSDEDAIACLIKLPGIGVWTAEMLLLFTYQRQDIVSYGDLIIKRGMERIYNIEKLTKKDFLAIRENYRPYGSIASFYLWFVGNQAIPPKA